MKVQDLASLISIRNYLVGARENKNMFRGETYKNVNAKISEIEAYLVDALLEFDVESIEDDQYVALAGGLNTTVQTVDYNTPIENVPANVVVGRQTELPFDPPKEQKPTKTVSNKKKAAAVVSDDDAALIAERVAAQKAALKAEQEQKAKKNLI